MQIVPTHSQRIWRVVSELRRVRVGPLTQFESSVVEGIVRAIDRAGGFSIKTQGSAARSGMPDLIGCYRGRFFAIEVKSPGREGTLTRQQAATLRLIERRGGIAFVATSAAQAMEVLRACCETP